MSATLVLIFFLSGVAALIFEALWFRLAGLSLGNSVWSATLVLAAFMAGLSLGNALIARLHHRVANTLRLYAILELAIGIGGFAGVLVLPRLTAAFAPLFTSIVDLPWLLNAVRLGTAFTVLVIPATAMGATLPVLTEALSRSNPNFGANVGKLYGWNTLGAMLGAIGTEVVLVRWLGITSSGLVALSLNLTAAAIALRLSGANEPLTAAPQSATARPAMSARTRRYLLAGFLSGAVMLALEVVWFRFLLLTYSGTALIFAAMLMVVLAGIGVGGIAAGRLARADDRCHRWLRHDIALSAALVVLTYYGFDLFTARQIRQEPTVIEFVGFAVFLMLPVALLSGAAFTMTARAVNEELGSSIRTAGITALWNTVGSMAGSLCAGFLLLPLLGMERSIFALAAVYCVTALIVPASDPGDRPWIRWSAQAAVAVAVACLVLFPFGLMQRSFFTIVKRTMSDHTLIETREGLTETIRYYRRDVYGAPYYYRLVTNDHSMSGTTVLAQRYMKLYVYLPLALRPDARDALLISFGVGSTAKALTDSANLRHIDIVDISRDILELSSVVYPGTDNPLRDGRVRVHIEDGRFFLNTTTRKYDLITSEPPPPKLAGVVNLYSEEYFRLIREHLTPGGYVSYWLPAHQLAPLDTLAIVKGFCNAFENCSLWSGGGLEWMLMGSNGPSERVSVEAFSAQWRDGRVAPELAALGFETPEQMGSLFMGDARLLQALVERVAPLTDNYPWRLSSTPAGNQGRVPLYEQLMDEDERRARFRESAYIDALWPRELEERSDPYFRYERMIKNLFTENLYRDARDPFPWEAIDEVLTRSNLETLPLWQLGSDHVVIEVAAALAPGEQQRRELELALGSLARRDFSSAIEHATRYAEGNESLAEGDLSLLLYLLAKNDRLPEARALIDGLGAAQAADMKVFVDWFVAKFEPGRSEP
jgi:spermidine synthase